jgi:hypothetical protein
MIKNKRKLAIHRDTIRTLSTQTLQSVAGGGTLDTGCASNGGISTIYRCFTVVTACTCPTYTCQEP